MSGNDENRSDRERLERLRTRLDRAQTLHDVKGVLKGLFDLLERLL